MGRGTSTFLEKLLLTGEFVQHRQAQNCPVLLLKLYTLGSLAPPEDPELASLLPTHHSCTLQRGMEGKCDQSRPQNNPKYLLNLLPLHAEGKDAPVCRMSEKPLFH